MARDSRHRSHKSRRQSTDRSNSVEGEPPLDRKQIEEEPASVEHESRTSVGARVSRDMESEKRRSKRDSDRQENTGPRIDDPRD